MSLTDVGVKFEVKIEFNVEVKVEVLALGLVTFGALPVLGLVLFRAILYALATTTSFIAGRTTKPAKVRHHELEVIDTHDLLLGRVEGVEVVLPRELTPEDLESPALI